MQDKLCAAIAQEQAKLGPTQIEHLTDHSKRVSDAAVKLGRRMGFDRSGMRHLRTAGVCHDLGKLIVPESILAKPGKLDDAEKQIVERHAEDGAAMAQMLGADDETTDFVRLHHRRFTEQSGYGGIVRQLLGAQVLSVADAFVAMTSNRSYQPARSPAAALEEIERERGRQFSPDVVDAARSTFASSLVTARAPVPV
jgi:putative nucleotidyltransferase with HDIG domain